MSRWVAALATAYLLVSVPFWVILAVWLVVGLVVVLTQWTTEHAPEDWPGPR